MEGFSGIESGHRIEGHREGIGVRDREGVDGGFRGHPGGVVRDVSRGHPTGYGRVIEESSMRYGEGHLVKKS